MAEYLASIFGTEKDKVNCPFYIKIGACRHGTACSRLHNKPTFSQTIVFQNCYRNLQNTATSAEAALAVSDVEKQQHYDDFFEDIFLEMEDKYGEVEEMNVCDNLGDHLVSSLYLPLFNLNFLFHHLLHFHLLFLHPLLVFPLVLFLLPVDI